MIPKGCNDRVSARIDGDGKKGVSKAESQGLRRLLAVNESEQFRYWLSKYRALHRAVRNPLRLQSYGLDGSVGPQRGYAECNVSKAICTIDSSEGSRGDHRT